MKNTNDFVKKINNLTVPNDSILVTIDVKSLYTSIPNHAGTAAVYNNSIFSAYHYIK